MTPGTPVYIGPTRERAVYQGVTAHGLVKVVKGGRCVSLPRGTRVMVKKTRHRWAAGPSAERLGEHECRECFQTMHKIF